MADASYPEGTFSVDYARKDLSYALTLADQGGIDAAGAKVAAALLERARRAGHGNAYYPVILEVLNG